MSNKAPKIQCFVAPHALQHKHQPIAYSEEKCTKENKEEAAEYTKHLDKKMKDAMEKCQEQIAKICRECFINNIPLFLVLFTLLALKIW